MLEFFDSHCAIGRQTVPGNEGLFEAPQLVEEMARVRIGEALVYHFISRDHSPASGNENSWPNSKVVKGCSPAGWSCRTMRGSSWTPGTSPACRKKKTSTNYTNYMKWLI